MAHLRCKAFVLGLLFLTTQVHAKAWVAPRQPKYDYITALPKRFRAIRDYTTFDSEKLVATDAVMKVIGNQTSVYDFGKQVAKTVAGALLNGGALNVATSTTLLKLACGYFGACFTTLSALLTFLSIPGGAAVILPAGIATAMITMAVKKSGLITFTPQHIIGMATHLAGKCYHGNFCGQACYGKWPPNAPISVLDEACYYHDICLENYRGPSWHCDVELRRSALTIQVMHPNVKAQAVVIADAMAHQIHNMEKPEVCIIEDEDWEL